MRRLTSGALFAAVTAVSSLAAAETQAELASKLNDEGKELMYANNYAGASEKFQQAIARVPEAKYFFNLCTSRYQEGQFSAAITACEAVDKNQPTPDLSAKATKLIGRIKDEAKAQGLNVEAGGGGGLPDPNTCATNPQAPGCAPPPPTCQSNPTAPECQQPVAQPAPVVGRPPTGTGVFAGTKAGDNKYIWTLGGNFFGGGGTIGQDNVYGNTAVGFELHGNYLFNPASRLGAQAYIQYAQFSQNDDGSGGNIGLTSVDFGIGLYKHLCPASTERLCLTPMVGAQLALYSPEFDQFDGEAQFNYAAAGARLELGLEYAFGSRMEHVLSIKVGANAYTAVFSGPADDGFNITTEMAGLDKGGGYGYFGVGYTHRFSTPLGSSPFVTLE